jgi:hypothetical protein
MKNILSKLLLSFAVLTLLMSADCEGKDTNNVSAVQEQAHTESNQQRLNQNQPLPDITWSMERDNLIKLKKLQNDRTVTFFMYVFIEGISEPIGYYQVNKVSSVNSQLSNPMQVIRNSSYESGNYSVLPSPSEDGSYGENGDAIFGFTPEDICIQTNMKYITATVPLKFRSPVNKLAVIDTEQAKQLLDASKKAMK